LVLIAEIIRLIRNHLDIASTFLVKSVLYTPAVH
jgi:hypothetical protein